jgi:Bacterial cadherin-like domain
VPAPGVLANDSDVDGNPLTAVLGASPQHGSLQLGADGSVHYLPSNNYVGLDNFTYRAFDGSAFSGEITVILDIRETNTPPVANDDNYTTPYNVKLVVPGPGLLANDSDPDGNQPIRAVLATQPANGAVTLTRGGGFEYTPAGGTCSADTTETFTYFANDGVANSLAPATVTITLTCTYQPPVAQPVPALGPLGLLALIGLVPLVAFGRWVPRR